MAHRHRTDAGPAEFLGQVEPHDPHLGEGLQGFVGDAFVRVGGRGLWDEDVLADRDDGVDEFLFIGGDVEGHKSAPLQWGSVRWNWTGSRPGGSGNPD